MNAPMAQTQGTTGNTPQDSMMVTEGLDMKAEMGKARVHISRALGDSIGTRFIRVVALGALLVGAAALYSSMSQGEAGSQAAPASVFMGYQDPDLAELPYDQLTKNFFGTGPSSGAMAANVEEDVAELPYDDLTRDFFGIASPGSHVLVYEEFDPAEWPYDHLTKDFFGVPLTAK